MVEPQLLGDIVLQSGATLRGAKLAYKTYGALNAKKDNVIVYPTWYSAQHYDNEWMIGESMALDPGKRTQVLAAVRVEGKLDGGLQTSGFNNRKKFGMGHFITPEDVARRRPDLFTDLLETVPGFRIATSAGGRIVQSTRATGGMADGCVNVFIDRSPFQMMQAGDLDMMLHTADVGAVEAYASATDTPAEFQVPGKSCASRSVAERTGSKCTATARTGCGRMAFSTIFRHSPWTSCEPLWMRPIASGTKWLRMRWR